MSSHRLGITKDTAGSRAKAVTGKLVKGRLTEPGTLVKSVHGTCLRAYSPAEQAGDPGPGRSSESPAKLLPALIRSAARFGAVSRSAHPSSVTSCVLPENSAR